MMPAGGDRYRLSFTTGGLLAGEARLAAEIQMRTGDWQATRQEIRSAHLLGTRTVAATTRISREVVVRAATLTPEEVRIVANGDPRDRELLMWSAATRRYRLIAEFGSEVLRARFLALAPTLELADFDSFLLEKASWAPEVGDLTVSTRRKLRQNLFRMMREAQFVSGAGAILGAVMSPTVAGVLRGRGREAFEVFPMTDTQITRSSQ